MSNVLVEIELFASNEFKLILPLIKKLALDLEAGLLPIAETTLASAAVGTPWPTIVASFIAAAGAVGKKVAVNDAATVLSAAEANLAAKGTPAPVTAASTSAVTTAA